MKYYPYNLSKTKMNYSVFFLPVIKQGDEYFCEDGVKVNLGVNIREPINGKKNYFIFYDYNIQLKREHIKTHLAIIRTNSTKWANKYKGISRHNNIFIQNFFDIDTFIGLPDDYNFMYSNNIYISMSTIKNYIRCPVFKFLFNPNPTLDETIKAIKLDGSIIKKIKNPRKELEYMAVRQNPMNIQYIENPSQDLQLLALSLNVRSFLAMKSPSYETMFIALGMDGSLIDCIKDPPEIFIRISSKQI